jgi:hypothetical protein
MPIRSYCRIPPRGSKCREGSCPQLFTDLKNELRDADTIDLAICLFTNSLLRAFLIDEAHKGCHIKIISLPPLGYNDKQLNMPGYTEKKSARDLAEDNYSSIMGEPSISLFIFPYMYYWYGASYSGNNPSYGFHMKAAHATFGDLKKSLIFSGNISTGDLKRSENMIVIENIASYNNAFEKFFSDIITHSMTYPNYMHANTTGLVYDFNFSGMSNAVHVPQTLFSDAFFTAPFYTVGEVPSNHYASDKIINKIRESHERIYICGQHVHDLGSYDPTAHTIFSALKEVKDNHDHVDIKMLKQLTHKGLSDKSRAAIAECFFKFYLKCPQRTNKLVHDKFIIADNTLIVSTANYTPTQFAYGLREMKLKVDEEHTYLKNDIFSEVNGFVIISDLSIVASYIAHFEHLWVGGADIEISL